jgi:phosphatidylglycerophosphate synthase
MNKFKIKDIEETLKTRDWWAIIFVLWYAKYIIWFIANKTKFTPNSITTFGFCIAIFSALFFYKGYFFWGAVLFQLSFALDVVDGSLARLKNLQSTIGEFYDVATDWIKPGINILALAIASDHLLFFTIILIISYIAGGLGRVYQVLSLRESLDEKEMKISSVVLQTTSSNLVKHILKGYIDFMIRHKLIKTPGMVEFEGMILFLFPLTGNLLFVYIALLIRLLNLLMIILASYKRFS